MVDFGARPARPPKPSTIETVSSIVVLTTLGDKVAYLTETGKEGLGFLRSSESGITLDGHIVKFKLLKELTASEL